MADNVIRLHRLNTYKIDYITPRTHELQRAMALLAAYT